MWNKNKLNGIIQSKNCLSDLILQQKKADIHHGMHLKQFTKMRLLQPLRTQTLKL
jgi:hypothetical protein